MNPSSQAHSTVAPMRVLLLDDDSFMLALLREMLEQIGQFEIACESNGKDAVATLQRLYPQLLICDLSMPDMDGIEFLRIAADQGFQGAVVLLTGMDSGVRKAAERLAMAQGLRILGAYRKPIAEIDLQHMLALARAISHDARA